MFRYNGQSVSLVEALDWRRDEVAESDDPHVYIGMQMCVIHMLDAIIANRPSSIADVERDLERIARGDFLIYLIDAFRVDGREYNWAIEYITTFVHYTLSEE